MRVTRESKQKQKTAILYVAHDKQYLIKSNPIPSGQAGEFAKRQSIDHDRMFFVSRADKGIAKYRAVKAAYQGVLYDSTKEANYAAKVDQLLKAGVIIKVERQVPFEFTITYMGGENRDILKAKGSWIADFVLTYADGGKAVVDVKGMRTMEYKRKKKIVEQLYHCKIIEA
jgi:hypothetical protein